MTMTIQTASQPVRGTIQTTAPPDPARCHLTPPRPAAASPAGTRAAPPSREPAASPIIRMKKGVVHDSYTIPEVDVTLTAGHTKGDEDV